MEDIELNLECIVNFMIGYSYSRLSTLYKYI